MARQAEQNKCFVLGEKRFLRTIRPRNILTFGPDNPELELQSLKVLMGPNGKSRQSSIGNRSGSC